MTTAPGTSALRLILTLLISTLLISCGGGKSAQEGNGAGIAFRLKWPVAKSVGLAPSGVDTIRMSVSGPSMATISKDFAASDGTGSITDVPVGSGRTITFQGFSGPAIIYQTDITNVTLVQGQTYDCGPVTMVYVSNSLSASTAPPTAPSGLGGTVASSTQIILLWVDNANNETGYKIERKTGADGAYAPVATVAANDTIYSDTSLSDSTTYYYRVRATNGVGDSGYSNEYSATTSAVAPASSYGISGTVTSGGSALAGATVTRSGNGTTTTTTDSGGNYSFSGVQNGSYTLTPGKAGYSFNPATLPVTVDGADLSALNFAAAAVSTIPAAPSGLSATVMSSSLVNLAWADNANNETGYMIYRKTGSAGTYGEIANVAANVTIYNDTTVSDSTTYYYRILATNGVGDSAVYSNEANAATPAPTYSISGTITSGGAAFAGATVTLTGSGSTATTTDSAGNYSFSGALNGDYILTPSKANYTFSPASLTVTVNGGNQSAMDFVATAVPLIPLAPSALAATAVSSNLINLSWKDNAGNETGYRIERAESGGAYAQIATVAANVTTYKDTVPAASTVFYRVQATSGVGDSGYSAEANVTTPVAGTPISPDLVTVTGTFNFSIGRFEVTQREWFAVMGTKPSNFTSCGPELDGLDCPVETVSWSEVQDFISTLNVLSGKNYRLPTEAEWQYAAQSGGLNEIYSGGGLVGDVAWYFGNSGNTTHPVGQKQANGLGIHDMSGNVWEWVNDWYNNSQKVIRGGCWKDPVTTQTTTFRTGFAPALKGNTIGFRLAM